MALTACQNDADIGALYGQWQLDRIERADTTATPTDLFLAFQSNVVFARFSGTDAHFSEVRQGTFVHDADVLRLSFFSTEDGTPLTTDAYLNSRFLFSADLSDLRFTVTSLSASSMTLQGSDGGRWHFSKF